MKLLTHWCNVIMYCRTSVPRKQFHPMAQSCIAKSDEGACGRFRPFTQVAGLPCKLRSKLFLVS